MIGLDLDGVVCDLLGAAKRSLGEPMYPQAYSFEEMYPHISDDALNGFFAHRTTYTHMNPIDGAVDSIRTILNSGKHIVYITARPPYLQQITTEWLKMYTIFAPIEQATAKEIAVQRLGVSVFVDDNPDVLKKLNCDTYLFTQPYNVCRATNARRVSGWAQLKELLLC